MTDAPERIKAWVTRDGVTHWEAGSLQFPPDTEVEYVRADLALQKVKELEWLESGFDQDADLIDTTFTYQIQEGNLWYGAEIMPIVCGTNEAAKAAAQADYERRILSALEAGHE